MRDKMKLKYIAEETIKTEKEETLLDILNQEDSYDKDTIEHYGENYKILVEFSHGYKIVYIQKYKTKTRKYEYRVVVASFETGMGLSNEEIEKRVEEIFVKLESQDIAEEDEKLW